MKTNTRKVWVNPVPRRSAQGRHLQIYQTYDKYGGVMNTSPLNKTKEMDTTDVYTFPITRQGRLHTGLNKRVINPFYKMDEEQVYSKYPVHVDYQDKLASVLEKEKISMQELLEIKHGKRPNDYNDNPGFTMMNPPSDLKDFDKDKSELANFEIVFYPRPNSFTNDSPRQELCIALIYALVDAGVIAESKDSANPSIHKFYISEDNQEEEDVSRKRDIIEEAMAKLYKLKNEQPEFRSYQVASLLKDGDKPIVTGTTTSSRVRNALSMYLDRDKKELDHAMAFRDLFDLASTPEGADRFEVMYLVQQAVNTRTILHRDNLYLWTSKSGSDLYELGNSFEKVVNFFLKEYHSVPAKGKSKVTNYYQELLEEVKSKGIRFE